MSLKRRAIEKRAAERSDTINQEAQELLAALQYSDFLMVPGSFASSPPTMLEPKWWLAGDTLYAQVEEGFFCLRRGKLHVLLTHAEEWSPRACEHLAALGALLDECTLYGPPPGAARFTPMPTAAPTPVPAPAPAPAPAPPVKKRGRT